MDYQSAEYGLAAGLLVFSMFGMGTTLTVADFVQVFKMPLGLVLVLLLQCLVAPLVAVQIGRIFEVSEGVAAGMLLVAALPGGSYTNLFTYLGRGNVALSVAATTTCTALCVVTTPLVLRVFGGGSATGEVVMPAGLIFSEIGSWLLLPLGAGMAARRLFPTRYAHAGKAAIWLSFALLITIIAGALAAGRLQLRSEGWRAPVALAAFGAVMLWTTYGVCLAARRTIADVFTIAIEVVVRNGNLALLLKASLYPDGQGDARMSAGVLYSILFYAATSLLIASFEVYVRRTEQGLIYGRGRG